MNKGEFKSKFLSEQQQAFVESIQLMRDIGGWIGAPRVVGKQNSKWARQQLGAVRRELEENWELAGTIIYQVQSMKSILDDIVKEEDIREAYDFIEVLSRGEFSCVLRAMNKKTNEVVAIKVFQKYACMELSIGEKGEERAYMENEMVILSQISHPNIVRFHEAYRWQDTDFLVLEMMNGGELFDRIVTKSYYSENEAKKVLRPIIDAIRYLHALQVVHRDLKPENILLDSEDEDAIIKLSDFGVSKVISNKTMTTTVGTAGYLAPEVLSQDGYDKSVDYWSIGVILYILLCGEPPFDDDDTNELFRKIKCCEYTFNQEIWGSISEEAKDLIKNLLVLNPKLRYDADKILSHKWMQTDTASESKNLTKTLDKLKQLKALRRMKRVSMAVNFIGRLQLLNLMNKQGKPLS